MKHSGAITKISNSTITVALEANINCESCKAKAACGVSESNAKEIEIENPLKDHDAAGQLFKLNEPVDVLMREELGLKAVFWAYVFPFILMVFTLFVASFFLSEWQSGLISLLVLLPYYLGLFLLNSFFKKRFNVTILKLT